jgi:hypothetical protein
VIFDLSIGFDIWRENLVPLLIVVVLIGYDANVDYSTWRKKCFQEIIHM